MLIRNADIWQFGLGDVRIENGRIARIGSLTAYPQERQIDAQGGALLPGLWDHHIHLAGEAAARQSVEVGPPAVCDEASLAAALQRPGTGWIRGIGYHESVAGMLVRAQIDAMVPDRPVRIQHRSGRMWFFNSAALDLLLSQAEPSPQLEKVNGRWTGRLFDDDAWVRLAGRGSPPAFDAVSRDLVHFGIIGVTDMSANNEATSAAHFASEQARGALVQKVVMAGQLDLQSACLGPNLALGPAKLHLHEWQLPSTDETVGFIRAAHLVNRAVAVHCTTEVELVYALAILREAGVLAGDRIEHAGIASNILIADIAELGLCVVSQPHFIAERGDHYLRDVAPSDHHTLYRLGAFKAAGVILAAGSDAPYGGSDPWASMRAAVSRQTASGRVMGQEEGLCPDDALRLFLADPVNLGQQRTIAVGAPADLCLLDRPWSQSRDRLKAADVRLTFIAGSIVYDRIDQPPC